MVSTRVSHRTKSVKIAVRVYQNFDCPDVKFSLSNSAWQPRKNICKNYDLAELKFHRLVLSLERDRTLKLSCSDWTPARFGQSGARRASEVLAHPMPMTQTALAAAKRLRGTKSAVAM